MTLTPMQEIKQRLIELGAPPEHIVGCTESQIAEIMQAQGVSHLPEIYLDFLRVMGQGAGPYLQHAFYYSALLLSKQRALDELEFEHGWRNELRYLPQDAFVFFMENQGLWVLFLSYRYNSGRIV